MQMRIVKASQNKKAEGLTLLDFKTCNAKKIKTV